MKAAVIAIRAGTFDDPCPAPTAPTPPAPSSSPAPRADTAAELGAPMVLVLAAHAGAGASTAALAIADAFAVQRSVQLVEYADPRRSGLGVAADSELGVDEHGWRRGRRGDLHLARLDRPCPPVDQWPAPPAGPHGDEADRLLVVDAGHLPAAATAGGGWLPSLLVAAALVVVTRVTVPGVRQTEHLLNALGVPAVLATVGTGGRWPGVVAASCGPHLRAAREAGRAVLVPAVRRLEIDGITSDPLPKPVAAAGKALAALLSPDQLPLPGLSLPAHRKAPS